MKKLLPAIVAIFTLTSGLANATDYSFTGNLNNDDDVQLFNFSVAALSTVTLRTWSYAGGTNAAGTLIDAGGFDPILALFDNYGTNIGQNDDGGANVAIDPTTGARFDTLLTTDLNAGQYTVAITQYSNFAGATLSDGFGGSGRSGFVDVTGNARTSFWAFDILNVQTANTTTLSTVPEPSLMVLLSLSFAGLGFAQRKRQA